MIKAKAIHRSFTSGSGTVEVLKGIDLHVKEGEFVAIMGRSGAGKSTLLYQLSLLDDPTSGMVTVDGVDTTDLDQNEKTKFRLDHLGYVFQDYAVLPELTAHENVALPLIMQGIAMEKVEDMVETALDRVGLGGEQQRVSIARAIAGTPKILFADEPTANLDAETADKIMKIFDELHKKGQTIVMVTHEMEYGNHADRIIDLREGKILSDRKVTKKKTKK